MELATAWLALLVVTALLVSVLVVIWRHARKDSDKELKDIIKEAIREYEQGKE